MPKSITQEFNIDTKKFKDTGVFDAILDIDSEFFIHPELLKITNAPELQTAYQSLHDYFGKILKLIIHSKRKGDRCWREAEKKLTFHEFQGICIGYSKRGTAGSGMGPKLRHQLLSTAKQIIDIGITDPEIFELVGLFEENIGCDRISDMIGRIIQDNLLQYSERIFKELGIQGEEVEINSKKYNLPHNRFNNKLIVLLPRDILDILPVALSWDDIDKVCSKNKQLRQKINEIIGYGWLKRRRKLSKRELKEFLLRNPDIFRELLDVHKNKRPIPYDFEKDPSGEILWHQVALEYTDKFPLTLTLTTHPTINDVEDIVLRICNKFKEMIEDKELWRNLYNPKTKKPFHESFAQRLFYTVADIYCEANNLDISPEANAGRGPVDFKISYGYKSRIVVEIKLSKNHNIIQGYLKQLPTYQKAEKVIRGKYLIIDVGNSKKRIEKLYEEKNKVAGTYTNFPEIIIIDATPKLSASRA